MEEKLKKFLVETLFTLEYSKGQEECKKKFVFLKDRLANFSVEGESEVPNDIEQRILVSMFL